MADSLLSIRPAERTDEDVALLSRFMNELAAFDGHQGHVEPQRLKDQLFHPGTNVRAFLAFRKDEPVGFILFYESFTVYYGERGLYVPGAYIVPAYRHKGYGVQLFRYVARYAIERGCAFMNWIVEEKNEKARRIYTKMGADISDGWGYVRVPLAVLEKAAQVRKHKEK